MKSIITGFIGIAFILLLIVALIAPIVSAFTDKEAEEGAVSYIAVVPKVLQAGGQEAVSLTLFNEGKLASGTVEVTLLKDGSGAVQVARRINGKGTIEFKVPAVAEGDYTIKVKGTGFEDQASVKIRKGG